MPGTDPPGCCYRCSYRNRYLIHIINRHVFARLRVELPYHRPYHRLKQVSVSPRQVGSTRNLLEHLGSSKPEFKSTSYVRKRECENELSSIGIKHSKRGVRLRITVASRSPACLSLRATAGIGSIAAVGRTGDLVRWIGPVVRYIGRTKGHKSILKAVCRADMSIFLIFFIDSHIQPFVLATGETTVTLTNQPMKPIKCQSRSWPQRGQRIARYFQHTHFMPTVGVGKRGAY